MNDTPREERLSKITTRWDEILAAHQQDSLSNSATDQAKQIVLRRYGDCVYKYILGATRNHHIAEDLTQDFALRFLRGDYGNARPEVGRFRDYLKTSLRNLVNDYFRKSKTEKPISGHTAQVEDNSQTLDDLEAQLLDDWRKQLLATAWSQLLEFEREKQNFFHTVLAFRAAHPAENSDWLAEQLSQQLNQPVTPEWVRQKLHRARKKFSSLLIHEVRQTMKSADELDQEIAELRLKPYVVN